MRIYTLWHANNDGEVPWICDAVDQYTVDDNGEFPLGYREKRADAQVRELIISVPEDAVCALFSSPSVQGTVLKDDSEHNTVSDALLLTGRKSGSGDAGEKDVVPLCSL